MCVLQTNYLSKVCVHTYRDSHEPHHVKYILHFGGKGADDVSEDGGCADGGCGGGGSEEVGGESGEDPALR